MYGSDWEQAEARRAAGRLRRQRLAAARNRGTHTEDEWRTVLAEVAGQCVACLRIFDSLTKDHVLPIYAGGSDSLGNLQPLCRSCNCAKTDIINWLALWRAGRR